MRNKKIGVIALTLALTTASVTPAFAASWQQDNIGYWYQEDNGSYPVNTWRWLDGNNDGIAECYYFDNNGYMLANTTTPDGYSVNSDGAWVENGVVQTQGSNTTNTTISHSEGYDPAHPLANKIDEYGLDIMDSWYKADLIVSKNIQARLTNQMEYYDPDMYLGDNAHIGRQREEELYNWFCNWLNGLDLDGMSEMDKAMEIKKILSEAEYDATNGNTIYGILIEKKGRCAEYAMTAVALAKAIGLKHAVSGSGNHMGYYIQVDGISYYGSNDYLNLEYPRNEWTVFD